MEPASYLDLDTLENRSEAEAIASQTLRSNIIPVPFNTTDPLEHKKYLLAGKNQYHTLWARDLSMSIAGTLLIGETQAARDSLEIFFNLQRSDGLLPRVVDNRGIASRVLWGLIGYPPPYKAPLRGWFISENRVISIDSNLMLPWAASHYIEKTKDEEFATSWFGGMEKALAFIEKNFMVEGLVGNQPPFSDWKDSIRRTGRVSFTNTLYILALRGAAKWSKFLGLNDKHTYFLTRAEEVTQRFRNYFWIPERRILRNFEGNELLTADANLFAVANQIIPLDEAREVMMELRQSPLWSPIPGAPTWPSYPSSLKSTLVKAIFLHGYHDRLYWLWISALAARAEKAVGNDIEYERIMNYLARRIVSDKGIYEVYDANKNELDLRPHIGPIYRADRSFTWSSACYLEAELTRQGDLNLDA
jgi:glycogen debranching enzyme